MIIGIFAMLIIGFLILVYLPAMMLMDLISRGATLGVIVVLAIFIPIWLLVLDSTLQKKEYWGPCKYDKNSACPYTKTPIFGR